MILTFLLIPDNVLWKFVSSLVYYSCDGHSELGTDNCFVCQGQIKLKETALETSTNSFLEKEHDLRHKIEELECRVEEFNQNSSFCKLSFEKVGNFINRVMLQRHAYIHIT